MATKRSLKKDISYLAEDLLTSACIKNSLKGVDLDAASQLIVKIVDFKNETIDKVNNVKVNVPKSEKKEYAKAVKASYSAIKADLLKNFKALAEAVSKL